MPIKLLSENLVSASKLSYRNESVFISRPYLDTVGKYEDVFFNWRNASSHGECVRCL
jgi:hypothetical protein